jgi:UDP-N-acetyl-2-amino-2-deoxyglucuronate dehydrogenase
MIGLGILGAGMSANSHRNAIVANADLGARLVGIGHYDPSRFDEIGTRFGVPCQSYRELLADPSVEVVCICTPSGQHAAQTIAAAEAGKHVLVEKPMALTLADADAMIIACERAGVKLGVHYQRRAVPLFQRVHRAIQAGDLGDLTVGLVTMPYYRSQAYFDQADWRGTWALDGGGVLMNQGIHIVDLLVWHMGDPVEVHARASTVHRDIQVEDTLVATLCFASGALATITATTTAAPGFPHRLEIHGTRGAIQIEGESINRWISVDASGATNAYPASEPPSGPGAGADPRATSPASHAAVVQDFVRAVRDNRAPAVDGAEGRRSLATVLAIYQAAGLV